MGGNFSRTRKIAVFKFLIISILASQVADGQGSSFLEKLRVGFGAGVNFSHILEGQSYNLYEDLSGQDYENAYTPFYRNFGHQYFLHVDWSNEFISIALKPGTYTYNFTRESTITFLNDRVDQSNPYTLRYFEIPLEGRYTLDLETVQPYLGGRFAYAHMLGSAASSNNSFIRPKMTLGVTGGTYIDLQYLILDVNLGYNYGLHQITSKSNRSETGRSDAFTQSDLRLNDIHFSVSALFALQKRRSSGKAACNYPKRGPRK